MRSLQILLLSFVLALLFILSPKSAFAASDITYGLNIGMQSLSGKNFPVDLTLLSTLPQESVQVQWIIPEGIDILSGENLNYQTSLLGNKLFKDHLVLVPHYPGRFFVNANITTLVNGLPQIKNLPIMVNFDPSLHLAENNDIYSIYHSVYLVWYTVCFIGCFLLFIEVYFYIKTKFLNWLNREG